MERDHDRINGSTITIIVEPWKHWMERRRVAIANGEAPPDRQEAYEVAYHENLGTASAFAKRRATMEEAIKDALTTPSPRTPLFSPGGGG